MLKLFDDTPQPGESLTGVIHTCDLCGHRGRWSDRWRWFGSLRNLDDGCVLKVCENCPTINNNDATRLLKEKQARQEAS